jgi:hypothetical protein
MLKEKISKIMDGGLERKLEKIADSRKDRGKYK